MFSLKVVVLFYKATGFVAISQSLVVVVKQKNINYGFVIKIIVITFAANFLIFF